MRRRRTMIRLDDRFARSFRGEMPIVLTLPLGLAQRRRGKKQRRHATALATTVLLATAALLALLL